MRAIAALKIGEVEGLKPLTARTVLERAMLDDKRIVRMNAAISLLNQGIQKLDGVAGESFEAAKADLAARGAFHADDAPQQLNTGRFHVLNGDPEAAVASFENSHRLDPSQPGIKFLMAVARLTQNRPDEARKLLEDIGDDDPFAADARELLKKLGN